MTKRLRDKQQDIQGDKGSNRDFKYLCTYDGLYGPVQNAFDAGSIHYLGKWEGVGPWKSSFLAPVKWHQAER
jgi:hypothetical protein